MPSRITGTALSALVASLMMSGLASADPIRVGSKNFTEQFVVAEIYAQALEKAGIEVQRRTNLGATLIAHQALVSGEIDFYPEYTGTALASVVRGELKGDAQSIYDQVKTFYESNFALTLLDASGINNGYAIVTLPETAERLKISNLSELGPVSGELSFGAEGGFAERLDGLPGMKAVYGIEFEEFRTFAQLGIRYDALARGAIDVGYGFTTDWQIAESNLTILEDDKQLFPPYFLVPIIRQDTLAENPQVGEVLNRVSALLTSDNVRQMNGFVDRDRRDPEDVATEFLQQNGL